MTTKIIPQEIIQNKIFLIRGKKVMLDKDLAELYGVETKQLKRAIKRNSLRFPADFLFELTKQEYKTLRCHFGTLKRGSHAKFLPYALTEHGITNIDAFTTYSQTPSGYIQNYHTGHKRSFHHHCHQPDLLAHAVYKTIHSPAFWPDSSLLPPGKKQYYQ